MTKYPDITVKLIGEDGNVFNLMGLVCRELRHAKLEDKIVKQFTQQMMSQPDYDHALGCIMEWVEVE